MSKPYNILTIQHYLTGKLGTKEMHQLEHDALNDPMLQDALDGFSIQEGIDHGRLSLLQKRLENRITEQREERNILHFTWQRLAVASLAGTLLIVIGVLFWMINIPETKLSSDPNIKEVEVTLTPQVGISLENGDIAPLDGWANYNHYLSINHQGELTGEQAILSFSILSGKPVRIEFLSRDNKEANNEALRLLLEGPRWKGNSGKIKISF